MPSADDADAGPGVGEPGRLEERLDRPVLAPRAVQCDDDTTGRVFGGEAIQRRAGAQRPGGAEARPDRHTQKRHGRPRRWSDGSHHHRPSRSMRTWRTSSPSPIRASAMAVPDTIETSCSADGPTQQDGDTAAVPRACHAATSQPDQSPMNSTSGSRSTPCRARISAWTSPRGGGRPWRSPSGRSR